MHLKGTHQTDSQVYLIIGWHMGLANQTQGWSVSPQAPNLALLDTPNTADSDEEDSVL